ncbi:MAG TPA: phenylacetate-CoA oxygenase/reductase subunit PaaK [Chitinophagaceae bacterium]|nr:phenylacetate-CoA oxygenase/reductase subunit PaaK [Chitinophagaceae bacterium]
MSKPQFYSLRVKEVKAETNDSVSVSFQIPAELKQQFSYQSGQYITIKKNIDGEEVRRSYSLCSSPYETEFRVGIKKIPHGKFSTFAHDELKSGDELEIMNPMGNFTLPENAAGQHFVGIAAGSGITPILSLMKSVLHQDETSTFTLVYGNQSFQTIMFREEIEALKNTFLGRLQLIHVLSRERLESEVNYGRINGEKCTQLFDKLIDLSKVSQFFICGPEEMILSVKEYLVSKGVNETAVRFELFNSSSSASKKEAFQQAAMETAEQMSMVTIKVDDRSIEIPLAFGGESILDAALKHGADLPFACKGGVCCTCRAKVIEGTVTMEVNYALEPDEVENGFVLTCQAHPTSEKVVIDFDAR